MTKILIATSNKGKKKEMLQFFGKKLSHNFLSLADITESKNWIEPEEDADTFEGNALIKAKFFGKKSKLLTLGEDSGLILDAFPDKFGLKTKREITAKDDMDWLTQFLELMDGVENRKATFYSAMAFYDPIKNITQTFLGTSTGTITDFPQAPLEKGIPVSAVFMPDGLDTVFSAMIKIEKNKISHRGKSAKKMLKYLEKSGYLSELEFIKKQPPK